MALKLYDTLTPDGDYPLMKAKDVEMPDGTRLSDFKGGGSAEIPVFDLAAMGLPPVDLNGGIQYIESDTTELFEALNKGAVKFVLPILEGEGTATGYITMHSFTDGATMHQCVGIFQGNDLIFITVMVFDGMLGVTATLMTSLVSGIAGTLIENANKPAPAVDLTAFESDGIIVETYADGSTVTTTMERNAEGKVTKITDSNGNETVLTW